MDETGAAADQSDPDADGIPNLVEFALGSHPVATPTPAPGTLHFPRVESLRPH